MFMLCIRPVIDIVCEGSVFPTYVIFIDLYRTRLLGLSNIFPFRSFSFYEQSVNENERL